MILGTYLTVLLGLFLGAGINDVVAAAPSDCAQYDGHCNQCTLTAVNSNCGYCLDTDKCIRGDENGPNSAKGNCSESQWSWNGGRCPTAPPTPLPPSPAPTAQPPRECGQYNGDCVSCVNGSSSPGDCGYCSSTSMCVHGTRSGPVQGECKGEWSWEQGSCPGVSSCRRHTTCNSCMDAGSSVSCGWCENEGKCREGTEGGPYGHQCSRSSGWHFESCPERSHCSQYDGHCHQCFTDAASYNCGYCADTRECIHGNSHGPYPVKGNCSSGNWFWSVGLCPTPPPTPLPPTPFPTPLPPQSCAGYGGRCYACTNDAPSENCGYCATTGKCIQGALSGPTHGSCSSSAWHYYGNNCPPNVPTNSPALTPAPTFGCSGLATCGACTSSPSGHCGFCGSSETCLAGNYNGPTTGACSGTWTWYASQCPGGSSGSSEQNLTNG